MIASLGSVGAGLVWGWLLGLRAPWGRRPAHSAAAAFAASLLFALEALALVDWRAAGILLASLVAGLLARLGWRGALKARYGAERSEGGLRA